jgi:hypothetical protein
MGPPVIKLMRVTPTNGSKKERLIQFGNEGHVQGASQEARHVPSRHTISADSTPRLAVQEWLIR